MLESLRKEHAHLRGADLLAPFIRDKIAGRIALVSSFGTEAAILLHMVSQLDKDTPVLFIDTRKLFGETHRYREQLTEHFELANVQILQPNPKGVMQKDPQGNLWLHHPNLCCYLRKVEPLQRGLEDYDAWITGRKAYQAETRKDLQAIEESDGKIKLNPLIDFTPEDVKAYFDTHNLPHHPLEAEGYPSIGCMPCTDKVEEGEEARSGRWRHAKEKTECGIHYAPINPFNNEEKS